MIINFLTVLAWIFITLGTAMFTLGIKFQTDYEDSLESMLDAIKGYQQSFKHLIFWGFWMILFSGAFLITRYLL